MQNRDADPQRLRRMMHIGNAAVSQGRNMLADALFKIWGSRIGCPRSPLPRGAQVFECFKVKLAIHGQGEVNLPGQLRSIGAAYEQPIGGFPVVKPFALLRQRQHVGTGITNGAEHPAVLGREGIGRKRLGEMVGREDH